MANRPETHVGLESYDAFTLEAPHIVGACSVVCADIFEAFINICRWQTTTGAKHVAQCDMKAKGGSDEVRILCYSALVDLKRITVCNRENLFLFFRPKKN